MKKVNVIKAGNSFTCFLYFICLGLRYLNISDILNFILNLVLIISLLIKYRLLWELLIIRLGKLNTSYIVVSLVEYIITLYYIIVYRLIINVECYENYIIKYCLGLSTFGFLVSLVLGFIEIYVNKSR